MAKYDGPQRKQKVTDKNGNQVTRKVGSNLSASVTSNAKARDAFYPRPARTDDRISHGRFAGSSHVFREAPDGYQEVTVTSIEFQGFTRGGAPKYALTADNGFTFESQDDDLGAFRSASPEYPIRVAYSTTLRRNSDERLTAVTGEAVPVAPNRSEKPSFLDMVLATPAGRRAQGLPDSVPDDSPVLDQNSSEFSPAAARIYGPDRWVENADGEYSRASDLDEDGFLIDRGD